MIITKLGFTFFRSLSGIKAEDGALICDSTNLKITKEFPSISPRLTLPPKLTNNSKIPFSLLFHKRNELIKTLIWKTSSKKSGVKSKSNKNQKLRKAILNCPPEEMLSLLKSQGLLNDDEPIPSSTPMKPVLPSLPALSHNGKAKS